MLRRGLSKCHKQTNQSDTTRHFAVQRFCPSRPLQCIPSVTQHTNQSKIGTSPRNKGRLVGVRGGWGWSRRVNLRRHALLFSLLFCMANSQHWMRAREQATPASPQTSPAISYRLALCPGEWKKRAKKKINWHFDFWLKTGGRNASYQSLKMVAGNYSPIFSATNKLLDLPPLSVLCNLGLMLHCTAVHHNKNLCVGNNIFKFVVSGWFFFI